MIRVTERVGGDDPAVSIICVNWNSGDYLAQCIRSIYRHTEGVVFEIIVVDNASTKHGLEETMHEFPDTKFVMSPTNLGFAGANNIGFKASHGNYVLFLNPDTELIGPTIRTLLRHIRDLSDAGIVGCKLLNSDLSVQLSSIQRFPTILNQVLDAEYLRLRWPRCPLWSIAPLFADDVTVMNVDVIPGACMLLKREVFERVGMFSEDYFMYAEDLDLNFKLKHAGFRSYYVGETAIIHHGGKSSSRQKTSHWATIRQSNAMLRLFTKRRGRLYGTAYRVTIGFAALVRLIILGVMCPVTDTLWKKRPFAHAFGKWAAVLKWALGWQQTAKQCCEAVRG